MIVVGALGSDDELDASALDADELDADALEASVLDTDVDAKWGEGYEDTLDAAAREADVASAAGDADTCASIPWMLACLAVVDRRRSPPLERRRAQCIARILDSPPFAAGVNFTTPLTAKVVTLANKK